MLQFQVESLRSRLRAFEIGNLPLIPQEFLGRFPQELPRTDYSMIERMWKKLTGSAGQDGDCNSIVSQPSGLYAHSSENSEALRTSFILILSQKI